MCGGTTKIHSVFDRYEPSASGGAARLCILFAYAVEVIGEDLQGNEQLQQLGVASRDERPEQRGTFQVRALLLEIGQDDRPSLRISDRFDLALPPVGLLADHSYAEDQVTPGDG